jgi:hypothetical protein
MPTSSSRNLSKEDPNSQGKRVKVNVISRKRKIRTETIGETRSVESHRIDRSARKGSVTALDAPGRTLTRNWDKSSTTYN